MDARLPLVFLLGFSVTATTIPIFKQWAPRFGLISMPAPDRWHQRPIPVVGGAALVASFLCGSAVMCMSSLLVCGIIATFLIGLCDDLIKLRPLAKLLCTVIAAGLLAAANWVPSSETILQISAGIVWILVCMHCINLLDHLDGLAAGVAKIASLAIALMALRTGQYCLAGGALALCGGLIGFLLYNYNPASVFMGDSGALPLGALLGVFTLKIGTSTSGTWLIEAAVMGFLMAVPLLDTSIVTITRLATGIPISRGGRDHSSHRLVSLGLSDRRAACVLYLVEALGACCAITVTLLPSHVALGLIPLGLLFFALAALFFVNLVFSGDSAPGRLYISAPRLARLILDLGYRRRVVEFGLDVLVIVSALYGSYLLDQNFNVSPMQVALLRSSLPAAVVSTYFAFLLAGVYRCIWRYTGIEDALRFAFAAILSGGLLVVAAYAQGITLSGSNIVIFALIIFTLLLATRSSLRVFLTMVSSLVQPERKVLIIGAGDRADVAARMLRRQMISLVGFVDEDLFKRNKLVHGSWVRGGIRELPDIYSSSRFHEILMADDRLSIEAAAVVKAFALSHGISVREFYWSPGEQPSIG